MFGACTLVVGDANALVPNNIGAGVATEVVGVPKVKPVFTGLNVLGELVDVAGGDAKPPNVGAMLVGEAMLRD